MTAIHEFSHAIVREPPRSVIDGLRENEAQQPDFEKLLAEHKAYKAALRQAGVQLIELDALEAFPDSLFVEDPALVFSAGAIVLRSGAPSRRGEADAITPVLNSHFEAVQHLPENCFVDGGDVLVTPTEVLIGLSERTNEVGGNALRACLKKIGIDSRLVHTPPGVLHFKSDCSLLSDTQVLSTRRLADSGVFDHLETILVDDAELTAANALRINDTLLLASGHPGTHQKLTALGFEVVELATQEITKVDAGLSCMSLRWKKNVAPQS
ncbi:MAG: arginine deiminase family protein [Pseudomonadota bacterium]